jgi:hypothetical protein
VVLLLFRLCLRLTGLKFLLLGRVLLRHLLRLLLV